jgi:hypothetical protein
LLGTKLLSLHEGTAVAVCQTASQQTQQASVAASDRRAFPRHDSRCVVSAVAVADDSPVSVGEHAWRLHASPLRGPLIDISMTAVAFLLSEPIAQGQDVLIRLSNQQLDKHVDARARVVRTTQEDGGRWKTVCRFHRQLPLEQIHDLSKHLFQSAVV